MTLWSDRLKGQINQEIRYRFDKICSIRFDMLMHKREDARKKAESRGMFVK